MESRLVRGDGGVPMRTAHVMQPHDVMRMPIKIAILAALVSTVSPLAATLLPSGARLAHAAPAAEAEAGVRREGSFTLRAGGSITISADEQAGLVIVLGGDARVAGQVDTLLVVGGSALLEGARVGELTVVGGVADLRGGAVVDGGVHLVGAELRRSADAMIRGTVTQEQTPRWGAFPFGLLFALGASLFTVLAGLIAVAVAPRAVASVERALGEHLGPVALAGVVLWLVVPPAAILLVLSIIGLPIGLGVLLFGLPLLAFLGYLLCGIALGTRLIAAFGGAHAKERRWLAPVVGLATLMLAGAVPLLGALVGLGATFLGGGAIGLVIVQAWRSRRRAKIAPGGLPTAPPGGAPLPAA